MSDSELVPRGKGQKNISKLIGEKEHETECCGYCWFQRTFCIMSQRLIIRGRFKLLNVNKAKASIKTRKSFIIDSKSSDLVKIRSNHA